MVVELGYDPLQDGISAKRIPKKGFLLDGREYTFHGCGCCVSNNALELDIDFEFSQNFCVGGFDSWRFFMYVEQRKDLYPNYLSEDVIRKSLIQHLESGELKKSGSRYDELYYLTDEASPSGYVCRRPNKD